MASPDGRTLRVHGFAALQRAFTLANRELAKELRKRLRKVAEPVRASAQSRAEGEIRNIGPDWSRMRTGITRRSVYVAPTERGVRRGSGSALARPNLAPLLMERAMSPALDANIARVGHEFESMLDTIGRDWERV